MLRLNQNFVTNWQITRKTKNTCSERRIILTVSIQNGLECTIHTAQTSHLSPLHTTAIFTAFNTTIRMCCFHQFSLQWSNHSYFSSDNCFLASKFRIDNISWDSYCYYSSNYYFQPLRLHFPKLQTKNNYKEFNFME